MRGSKRFMINGKLKSYPLFEHGDRVRIKKNHSTAAEEVVGTVVSAFEGGLFVNVKWDKEEYPCALGGIIKIGSGRMVDGLEFIGQ